MEKKKHIKRHKELHRHLDELLADFLRHNNDRGLSNTTLTELMKWSYEQTINPTEQKNGSI